MDTKNTKGQRYSNTAMLSPDISRVWNQAFEDAVAAGATERGAINVADQVVQGMGW